MGYPTDVRHKHAEGEWGCNMEWTDAGTSLNPGEDKILSPTVTGKAGKVYGARLATRHPEVEFYVKLDSQEALSGWRGKPRHLLDTYGCCGVFGLAALMRYDTVDNKYVIQLIQPLEFGTSMQVHVKNHHTSSVRCCVDVDWVQNL